MTINWLLDAYLKDNKHQLKEVEFIAGKSENQADKFFFIHFSINNSIANIRFLYFKLS